MLPEVLKIRVGEAPKGVPDDELILRTAFAPWIMLPLLLKDCCDPVNVAIPLFANIPEVEPLPALQLNVPLFVMEEPVPPNAQPLAAVLVLVNVAPEAMVKLAAPLLPTVVTPDTVKVPASTVTVPVP